MEAKGRKPSWRICVAKSKHGFGNGKMPQSNNWPSSESWPNSSKPSLASLATPRPHPITQNHSVRHWVLLRRVSPYRHAHLIHYLHHYLHKFRSIPTLCRLRNIRMNRSKTRSPLLHFLERLTKMCDLQRLLCSWGILTKCSPDSSAVTFPQAPTGAADGFSHSSHGPNHCITQQLH